MSKTRLSIDGEKFLINNALVYEEIEQVNKKVLGTLMNARFIQGIFDSNDGDRFNRYGKVWDVNKNTEELIASLPAWYEKGLRAITVGMQGGGNCYTIQGDSLKNNPFSFDGKTIDPNYLERLEKIIKACDELGMVVIVSYFYCHNVQHLDGAQGVIQAVISMTEYLKNSGYTNLIIEIANEFDIKPYERMPIIHTPQGMVALIEIAKMYSGGIPVGCSGGGGYTNAEVCKASDVIIIHGNGESRSFLYNHICLARSYSPGKPVLINEDSQAIGQLTVCEELEVSWGYYNNMTKQEVPTYWEITKGEDDFFARRMAKMIGIEVEELPEEEQIYFQGFEPHMHHNGLRFPRVASLYPEKINFVKFFENDTLIYVCYDECFTVHFRNNWRQMEVETKDGDVWKAEVHFRNGEVKTLTQIVKNA